jgi:Pyruvate/2-oxoacid:ferredoxin oxidoreductase delta subunit
MGVGEKTSWPDLYERVVQTGLCAGCGACVMACPRNVLDYDQANYRPVNLEPTTSADQCAHGARGCDICTRACPRLGAVSWAACLAASRSSRTGSGRRRLRAGVSATSESKPRTPGVPSVRRRLTADEGVDRWPSQNRARARWPRWWRRRVSSGLAVASFRFPERV